MIFCNKCNGIIGEHDELPLDIRLYYNNPCTCLKKESVTKKLNDETRKVLDTIIEDEASRILLYVTDLENKKYYKYAHWDLLKELPLQFIYRKKFFEQQNHSRVANSIKHVMIIRDVTSVVEFE